MFAFGDADRLADQRIGDIQQAAVPFDLAVGANPADFILPVVRIAARLDKRLREGS